MNHYRAKWISKPSVDLLFLTPILSIPLFFLAKSILSLASLKLLVLAISATGHHLPGFIRAYTDTYIWQQFRVRLVIVPVLFVILGAFAIYLQLSTLFLVLILWGTWHGILQVYGFLRIYDAKALFFSPLTAKLDFALCISWFALIILYSPHKLSSIISSFYIAGGPIIPPGFASFIKTSFLIGTLLVTALYLFQIIKNGIQHKYWNIPKVWCTVSSIAFWWYCMISLQDLLLGLILWEIFHDLQYNVFVWSYNQKRVELQKSQSIFETFLFKPNVKRAVLYISCIILYGCLGLLPQNAHFHSFNPSSPSHWLSQIGNIFIISALLHFYIDGFIWKIRDNKVQQDLGITKTSHSFQYSSLKHWIFIASFVLSSSYLAFSEYSGWHASQKQQADNLVQIIPQSGYANFMKASQMRLENKKDSAITYYLNAVHWDSNYRVVFPIIADLMYQKKNIQGAILYYQKSHQDSPDDIQIAENLGFLYLDTKQYSQSFLLFKRLTQQVPNNAVYAYNAAWSLLQQKKGNDAKPYLEKSIRLDNKQPRALNYLGMIEHAQGNLNKAKELYKKSISLDSNYAHPKENLRTLFSVTSQ